VAALSGSLDRHEGEMISLKHPTVQVFEKKTRPEAAPNAQAPAPKAPDPKAPEGKASEGKAPEPKAPPAPAPAPTFPKLTLKGRGASKAG
jgi:hypothetical protein